MTSPPAELPSSPGGECCPDKCMVYSAAEIRAHLQRLLHVRSVLVGQAEGATGTQVTALLHVGDSSLLVDVPRTKEILHAWLDSPRLRFEGSVERISVSFASGPAWLDQHDGQPALGLPFPSRLLYQQRREFLRIAPPAGALRCRLPKAGADNEPVWIDATIRDVGGGGLAMLVPSSAIALTIGEVLEGCVIELPQLGSVSVKLLIRHLVVRETTPVAQAGCEFVDLSPAVQDKLLRYVMQLDRERVSRRRAQE